VGIDSDNLFSALVGALLALLLTTAYTEIRQRRQGVRECAGLARLLVHEVTRNDDLNTVRTREQPATNGEEQEEVLSATGENRPSLQAWMEVRTRLAQLMKREDFNVLDEYYSTLQSLVDRLGSSDNLIETASLRFLSPTQRWQKRTEEVKALLKLYAEPRQRKTLLGF
jgi:hypothetical protein